MEEVTEQVSKFSLEIGIHANNYKDKKKVQEISLHHSFLDSIKCLQKTFHTLASKINLKSLLSDLLHIQIHDI